MANYQEKSIGDLFLNLLINLLGIGSLIYIPLRYGLKIFFICVAFLLIQVTVCLWNKKNG